jgi:hypothetical protein
MLRLETPVFASNSFNDTHIPNLAYKYIQTGRRDVGRLKVRWGYQSSDEEVSQKLTYTLLLVMMTAIRNFC